MQPASARVGESKPRRISRTRDSWPGFARIWAITVRDSYTPTPSAFAASLVKLNELEDVAVHQERENTQQKDQTNLNESFFYRKTQIPAQGPFDRQHQKVATVEDRNREQIDNSEIEADKRQQRYEIYRAALGRPTGLSRNANDSR